MYKVLDIDVNGMNSIKFLKSPDSETKWVLDTDLEHIFMTDEAQIKDFTFNLRRSRTRKVTDDRRYLI